MDGTDLRWFVERLRLNVPEPRLMPEDRSRLFTEPRCHGSWLPLDVPDGLLEDAWELACMGPTSANGSPLRMVLLRTAEEKARLLPTLDRTIRGKSRLAPVVAILACDLESWRYLPPFREPAVARETAFRNGTLQAAYFILAVRAMGADACPVSGFDATAVQAEFFARTTFAVNFICNIGYGDPVDLEPRLPRLRLEEIVHRPAPGH